MPDFTAKDVQELRKITGAGMMDAKKALTEANGDMEAAKKLLRDKLGTKAEKLGDRDNPEGAVAIAEGDGSAALVELKAETDFSAKAEDFTSLAQKLADSVLADGLDAVVQAAPEIEDLKISKKENIEIGVAIRFEAAAGNEIDAYLHQQDGRGKVGVLVEGEGVSADQLHQIALHVAFARPEYLTRDEVPADEVEKERAFLEEQTRKEGKPEQALTKIVEGKLTAFFKDRVLMEQDLFGDKKEPVSGALEGGKIVRFAVAAVGS